MASERRIAGPEAKNRGALLDAAESLMRDEGYAAVTSRRVAERAGLKPQLVHYYFRTMDDLFRAVFRRRTEQGVEAQQRVRHAPNPLRALWMSLIENHDTALVTEYAALANHRKELRPEIADAAQQFLEAQMELAGSLLARHGIDADELPPAVAVSLIVGMSQLMALEDSLGLSVGRDEIIGYFDRHLRKLDGSAGNQ
ncbi:TetR/AcrR family transcriptional regulator [Mycolicibacterium llatzerense]|uniref:TetR/AcrR family transcriptional regulator n=1 Tax=Mycolicibacterium llatzerense TaxID=280871 RepID=UPI0021B6C024|nr:TetR/AcrR family transcriptional regulator [Mycolicibacterium llatzerense]MCT7366536.1 TetR family transcriptional regulator [Mycolicibacterium llatzerense]